MLQIGNCSYKWYPLLATCRSAVPVPPRMIDLRSIAPHCALCMVNAAEAVEVLSAGYILSQVTNDPHIQSAVASAVFLGMLVGGIVSGVSSDHLDLGRGAHAGDPGTRRIHAPRAGAHRGTGSESAPRHCTHSINHLSGADLILFSMICLRRSGRGRWTVDIYKPGRSGLQKHRTLFSTITS